MDVNSQNSRPLVGSALGRLRLGRGRLLAGAAAFAAAGFAGRTAAAARDSSVLPDGPDAGRRFAPGTTDQEERGRLGDAAPATFEVAENGLRFIFDETPVHEDGMPAYGNPFVTEGYLYPSGTLNGSNGVLADGKAEFPQKVIGTWICRGYMIGDGAHTETGPWVTSTQTYNFGKSFGEVTLVTEGFELADKEVPVTRAVIGGTGPFRNARGEQHQILLGFTEQMGVNLRVKLDVQPR